MNVPRVEPCQLPVAERVAVVQAHELHEHVGDEHAQVLDVARLVLERHDLDAGFWRAQPFDGRRRPLPPLRGACFGGNNALLVLVARGVSRRLPRVGLSMLCGCGRRVDAQRWLGRRWRVCGGSSRSRGGALWPLCIHDGGRAEGRRGGLVGRGLLLLVRRVVGGGKARGRVLGAGVGVGVGALRALRRGAGAAAGAVAVAGEERHLLGGLRRVEAPRSLRAHGLEQRRARGRGRGDRGAAGMVRARVGTVTVAVTVTVGVAVLMGGVEGSRGRGRRGEGWRGRGQHRARSRSAVCGSSVELLSCPCRCRSVAAATVAQDHRIQYSAGDEGCWTAAGRLLGGRLWRKSLCRAGVQACRRRERELRCRHPSASWPVCACQARLTKPAAREPCERVCAAPCHWAARPCCKAPMTQTVPSRCLLLLRLRDNRRFAPHFLPFSAAAPASGRSYESTIVISRSSLPPNDSARPTPSWSASMLYAGLETWRHRRAMTFSQTNYR